MAGQKVIAMVVHVLAKEVMALNEKIAEIDKLIEGRFREHEGRHRRQPGRLPHADRLAAFGDVAPAPHDSGKTSGRLRRPQRYHWRLQRVFYVIPSGFSFNLDGSAVYLTMAFLFLAQAMGIDLSWQQQQIMVGVMPRYDRNTNTGGVITRESEEQMIAAVNHIHHGPNHPSRLVLPVINRKDQT